MKSRLLLFVGLIAALAIGYMIGRFSDPSRRGDFRLERGELFHKLDDSTTIEFPNYGIDGYNFHRSIIGYMPISAHLPLRDQMQELASRISKLSFRGLPILVTSIVDSGGVRIANIDLRDIDTVYGHRWAGSYFQGSTGGCVTEGTLIENFLQRDYGGNWVDGIVITYEGKTPAATFDHVPQLDGLILRSNSLGQH